MLRMENTRKRLPAFLAASPPRAKLKNVHHLRHTCASVAEAMAVAIAASQGLPTIGELLGNSQVQTTARYARLAGDPVRAAANDGRVIVAHLG
jgi:integrase